VSYPKLFAFFYNNSSTHDCFLGPAIYIYGNTGPTYGSFQVEIDSEILQYSAYRESAANSSTLLFAASNLSYAHHNLVLRNLGARPDAGDKGGDAFLLDYIQSTIQLAPAGWVSSSCPYDITLIKNL